MQEDITDEEKIGRFIDQLGCNELSRITASFVSRELGINIDFVKRELLKLARKSKLDINYELECPNSQCARTIQVYRSSDRIPLRDIMECMDCGEVFNIGLDDIWVTYDPNKDYFSKERCKDISDNKKNPVTITGFNGKASKDDDDKSSAYVNAELLKVKNGYLIPVTQSYCLIIYFTTSCIVALVTVFGILNGKIPAEHGATIIGASLGGNFLVKKILDIKD
jgi:hypothetical protein